MTALIELSDGTDPGWTLLASPTYAQRAQELGRRLTAARRFFTRLFDTDVEQLRALVLDEPDWREHCPFPDYGMPFHQAPATLYAAAADNELWRSAMPDLATLPPPVVASLTAAYGEPDGFSARRFFDLLAVHELAHLFAHQGQLRFPRRWLTELFCNLALHAFVETEEPTQLSALETLPEVVAAIPVELLPHHTLADWEELLERVGPLAFAWYQSRLHRAAATIYRSAGPESATAMWVYFANTPGGAASATIDDRDLDALLADLPAEIAAVAATWPGNKPEVT